MPGTLGCFLRTGMGASGLAAMRVSGTMWLGHGLLIDRRGVGALQCCYPARLLRILNGANRIRRDPAVVVLIQCRRRSAYRRPGMFGDDCTTACRPLSNRRGRAHL